MVPSEHNTPSVSVIVAAYNAEKYIRRSLDSLIAQTLNDFEVIIVDDGSTDSTPAIADEYAANDLRFKVIHKPNGGVASARQVGMDSATGDYTIHVDADDWTEPEMLEEMYLFATKERADVVISDIWAILANGEKQYWEQRPDTLNHIDVMGQMMGELYGSLWNKLIKRSCYTDFNISFRNDVTVCEDQLVLMTILSHPVKISYVNKAYYHYDQTQNANSFVNRETPVAKRLLPLEIIASTLDISPVQQKFDNAVFRIAYHALFVSKEYCPDYPGLFRKYKKSIKRAQANMIKKLLVLLRVNSIPVPISIFRIKALFK